jgi:hypothetical protein
LRLILFRCFFYVVLNKWNQWICGYFFIFTILQNNPDWLRVPPFLENITDNRKERKKYCKTEPSILQLLWRIFFKCTIRVQWCGLWNFRIQELNVIEQRYGKSIDKEIAMGAQNGLTSIPSTALQIVWIR